MLTTCKLVCCASVVAISRVQMLHSVPDQVINASSTNAFKNRLDKYWESEEIYYSDHRAEISGGNRSDIQLPEIDTIGESGEVAPRGASSGNHRCRQRNIYFV